MGDDEVVAIVGSDSGMSVIWRLATGEDAWAIVYTVQGGPREISGVEGLYGIDCAVGEGDSSRIVRLGFSGAAETLLEVTSHLVAISARDARFEATWLYRLEDGGPWKVGREFIGK
jgi:hypothetical protein